MPVLKSLSFTAIPKTGNDPVHMRRTKFVSMLEEQKLLLADPNHVRTVQRWTKVNGERHATTKQQAVRPWWKTDPSGQVVMSIKFGAKPIEFGQPPGWSRLFEHHQSKPTVAMLPTSRCPLFPRPAASATARTKR